MSNQDSRWIQRSNSFDKAFAQLKEAVELARQRQLSKLEAQGLIQGFEYTHELAWNTLKRLSRGPWCGKSIRIEGYYTHCFQNGFN